MATSASSGGGQGTQSGSGAKPKVASTIQLSLAKYYKGEDQISPKDVLVEAVCRKTTRGGVDKLKRSFMEVGLKQGINISVNLSDGSNGFRYSIIDGSHRILALKELGEQYPESWGKVFIGCSVYENLPSELMLLASEEANKVSQLVVATSGADNLYFMHQVITKILPAAPTDTILRTRGTRGDSRYNVSRVQSYLKSLGHLIVGRDNFYKIFNGYYTLEGKPFDIFEELCAQSSEFSAFFTAENLYKLFRLLEQKSEIFKIACLRRMLLYFTENTDVGVPSVSKEDILALCCKGVGCAETNVNAFLEEVNKLGGRSGGIQTMDELDKKEANYCDMVLNTWRFDGHLAQSVVKNQGLQGEFGTFVAFRRSQMKAVEERAQLVAQSSEAARSGVVLSDRVIDAECSGAASSHRLIDASVLDFSEVEGSDLAADQGHNSGDERDDGDDRIDSVEETKTSTLKSLGKRLRKKSGGQTKKKVARKSRQGRIDPDEVPLTAAHEEVQVLTRVEMSVADKLKILETYSGNFVCADTFPVGLTADLIILHDQQIDTEARAALITSAAHSLAESGTLVVMCEFFSSAGWKEDLESYGKLIVERAPLVVVSSPSKATKDTTSAVAFQHSVTRFALVAHKSLQPKHTYLSSDTKRHHHNLLIRRQPGNQIDNANAVFNYNEPEPDNFVLVKAANEVHPELYSFLIERYTNQEDMVMCFPMATGWCGCAALKERRKFYGADPLQDHVDEAILRAFKVKTTTTAFGVDGETDAIDLIPEADVTFLCPPAFRNRLPEDFTIDMAKEEADKLGLEIKESLIPGAGDGLFTTSAVPKGHLLCFYWGEALFRSPTGVYNVERYNNNTACDKRLIVTGKKQLQKNLEHWTLVIDGSKGCAATYCNDPRTTEVSANALFDECIFGKETPQPGEVTSPPLFSLIALRANRALKKGEEIYTSYGQSYGW